MHVEPLHFIPPPSRRPTVAGPRVPHRTRPDHDHRHPVRVTMRMTDWLFDSLRDDHITHAISLSLARMRERSDFRVVHYTIQMDHLHFIVEADNRVALMRGLQGLAVSLARRINRATGRSGRLFGPHRYEAEAATTPRHTRNVLAKVLFSFAQFGLDRTPIDSLSSARWFDGLEGHPPLALTDAPVAAPRTWLLKTGWRTEGRLTCYEAELAVFS
jgi:REP element-mobilizing transposase RayT